MRTYASNRPGANLACFLAVFGMVLTGGSAIAQLVIDYPRDAETVVVSFIEVLDEIKDQDRDEVFSGRPGDERFSAGRPSAV